MQGCKTGFEMGVGTGVINIKITTSITGSKQ